MDGVAPLTSVHAERKASRSARYNPALCYFYHDSLRRYVQRALPARASRITSIRGGEAVTASSAEDIVWLNGLSAIPAYHPA